LLSPEVIVVVSVLPTRPLFVEAIRLAAGLLQQQELLVVFDDGTWRRTRMTQGALQPRALLVAQGPYQTFAVLEIENGCNSL
jgi:hypothetical protein